MAISESLDGPQGKIRERILSAATYLFSHGGYNGVSTREIALSAGVNEATIYRYYQRKRNLYLAVLAEELGRVHLRGDQLREIAEAADARQALTQMFALIENAVLERPLVLPLILYGSLEASTDVDSLLKTHLGEFVEVLARYLDPWIDGGGLLCRSTRGLVMALVSIAVFRQSLTRVFPGAPTIANAAEAFTDLYAGFSEPAR